MRRRNFVGTVASETALVASVGSLPVPSTTRRAFLAGVAGAFGAGSGCSALRSRPAVRLAEVTTENLDDGPHTVGILVRHDGELVHWSTHDLDARDGNVADGAVLSCSWPSAAGSVSVVARLDDADEWRHLDLTTLGGDYYAVSVSVERRGHLVIAHTSNRHADRACVADGDATESNENGFNPARTLPG